MPLTADRDLKRKLLYLFPSKILKSHFDQTGNMDAIVEIISDSPNNVILDFVFKFHGVTKQNVHLFAINRRFDPQADMTNFPLTISKEEHNGSYHKYLLFPELTYTVYLNDPVEIESITFLQPALLEIRETNMSLRFTKLSKNIQSYFPEERFPRLLRVTNAEESAVSEIISHFRGVMGVAVNDFNQGIKHLWQNDDLDCSKITYRDAASTHMINMNGELTFKQSFPDKYIEMRHDPIGPSIWKTLIIADNSLNAFQCDPSAGTFNINRQSENQHQVDNAITRILTQN